MKLLFSVKWFTNQKWELIFRKKTNSIFRKMFDQTKHGNWFSVKCLYEPNTGIDFPQTPEYIFLSENAFTRTKQTLICGGFSCHLSKLHYKIHYSTILNPLFYIVQIHYSNRSPFMLATSWLHLLFGNQTKYEVLLTPILIHPPLIIGKPLNTYLYNLEILGQVWK